MICARVTVAVTPVVALARLTRAATATALVALPEYDTVSSPATVGPRKAVPDGPVILRSVADATPVKAAGFAAPDAATSAPKPSCG